MGKATNFKFCTHIHRIHCRLVSDESIDAAAVLSTSQDQNNSTDSRNTISCRCSITTEWFVSNSQEWLSVKTASEMTYTVSGGALNSAQSNTTEWTHAHTISKGSRDIQFQCIGATTLTFKSHMTSSVTWLFDSQNEVCYRCSIDTDPLSWTVFLRF